MKYIVETVCEYKAKAIKEDYSIEELSGTAPVEGKATHKSLVKSAMEAIKTTGAYSLDVEAAEYPKIFELQVRKVVKKTPIEE